MTSETQEAHSPDTAGGDAPRGYWLTTGRRAQEGDWWARIEISTHYAVGYGPDEQTAAVNAIYEASVIFP